MQIFRKKTATKNKLHICLFLAMIIYFKYFFFGGGGFVDIQTPRIKKRYYNEQNQEVDSQFTYIEGIIGGNYPP